MAFFEDLTEHTYTKTAVELRVLNVGWLGRGHIFPTGETTTAFREALELLCQERVLLHRGFHTCEFCLVKSRKDWGTIGNGQIRIRSQSGVWHSAPIMIHHCVCEHNYLPPDEFIEAVLNPREVLGNTSHHNK